MSAIKFYLTTPIYYVNDKPHIGHAYTTAAADVLTRWHRMRGENVRLLTGTDEHGQKVLNTAIQNNVTPKEWCDNLVEGSWKPLWKDLNIKNDDFIRTTEERHTTRVQKFAQKLKDLDFIYEDKYEGPYCVGCEEFKLEGDLIDGKCKIHDKVAEVISETNWFFRLSAFAPTILKYYEENKDCIAPQSANNEITSFLRGDVTDISISRSSFSWGIPVPWDTDQVIYVWFDALLNYATAVGLGDEAGSIGAKDFEKWWPADVHLVGKDILRLHTVLWPAMLIASLATKPGEIITDFNEISKILPRKVFAHGWLLVGGEKMSKSKLTGIAPAQITDTFGVDAFRYYFLRAISFGSDGSFSWEDMAARYTAELGNIYGNLAERLISMVERYCGGVIPTRDIDLNTHKANILEGKIAGGEILSNHVSGYFESDDDLADMIKKMEQDINNLALSEVLVHIVGYARGINQLITLAEPWKIAKQLDNADLTPDQKAKIRGELEEVLYVVAEALRNLAIMFYPFMPTSSIKLWRNLGFESSIGPIDEQRVPRDINWNGIPKVIESRVTKGEILFPRLEEEK